MQKWDEDTENERTWCEKMKWRKKTRLRSQYVGLVSGVSSSWIVYVLLCNGAVSLFFYHITDWHTHLPAWTLMNRCNTTQKRLRDSLISFSCSLILKCVFVCNIDCRLKQSSSIKALCTCWHLGGTCCLFFVSSQQTLVSLKSFTHKRLCLGGFYGEPTQPGHPRLSTCSTSLLVHP